MKEKKHIKTSSLLSALILMATMLFVLPAYADNTLLPATKAIALEKLDMAFLELAMLEQEEIELATTYLPQSMAELVTTVIAIAKQDISTEEKLDAIEAPPAKWDSPTDAFQATYDHEQKVTELINDLLDLAVKEKDNATQSMLKWFIDEQVEEEDSALEILDLLKKAKGAFHSLMMINKQLAMRGKD